MILKNLEIYNKWTYNFKDNIHSVNFANNGTKNGMVAMQTKARCLQIDEKLGGHLLYLDTCTEAAIFDLSNFILRDLKRSIVL